MSEKIGEFVLNESLVENKTGRDFDWTKSEAKHARAVNALLRLTVEQRKAALKYFCRRCGGVNQHGESCYCDYDE